MKKFLFIVTLLVSLVVLTGCMNKKALTSTEVKDKANKLGLRITDTTTDYSEYAHVKETFNIGNENFYVQFIVVSDVDTAKLLFQRNKELIDGSRNGKYTNKSLSGKNYESYELISDGYYMYVSRIDNTLVYTNQKEEYKADIKNIIKKLGY